ncbi:hypothetical protein BY458DRAFT_456279 [Sporodiniella umbellata]|nr:hypothetical protein BY458DRAFT_456279 [Sporodiniella umbellata]
MDYEDSFYSAPVRYAVEELDSDEELELDTQELNIQINATVSTNITLVLGPSGPGQNYIESLPNLENIGAIILSDKQETKATLFQSPDSSILFISFVKKIEAEEAVQYTKSILDQFRDKITQVIVLDTFAHDNSLTPPSLRVLQTSVSPVLKTLSQYEIPHMVTGLPAAVLNHCEIHSIPCYNLLTLQEYVYGKLLVTEDTLVAYEQGLKQLGLDLKFNSELLKQSLSNKGRIDDNHHRLYI